AEHPDWNYHQLIDRLRTTVDRLPQYANVAWGGRLDLAAAVGNPPPVVTNPPAVLGLVASGPAAGQINQVRISFNQAIDPATFTIAGDLALAGPNGAAIPITGLTAVAGSNNTQFVATFATQTAQGTYHLTVGPRINNSAGTAMAQPYSSTFTIAGPVTFNSGI